MQTKYTITNLGKPVSIDGEEPIDPEEHLGPITRDGVMKLLIDRKVDVSKILIDDEARRYGIAAAEEADDDLPETDEWSDVDDEV